VVSDCHKDSGSKGGNLLVTRTFCELLTRAISIGMEERDSQESSTVSLWPSWLWLWLVRAGWLAGGGLRAGGGWGVVGGDARGLPPRSYLAGSVSGCGRSPPGSPGQIRSAAAARNDGCGCADDAAGDSHRGRLRSAQSRWWLVGGPLSLRGRWAVAALAFVERNFLALRVLVMLLVVRQSISASLLFN
jgi:hypothetical protein